MLSLEEAIRHYEESEKINKELAKNCMSAMSKNHNLENAEKCRQMIEWLRELQERRKIPEIITCGECAHRYVEGKNVRFNRCELDHNNVMSDDWYCADAERRTDETD